MRLEEAPDKRSASSRPTQNISGCVEVCYNDEYRGLCSPVFDEREAAVVCRELGFYAALGKRLELTMLSLFFPLIKADSDE